MILLYVNVDHVATIREARKTCEPDPLVAALLAEIAGADGITIHLREDRRHIQNHDLTRIRESIKTHLNLEIAPTNEMVQIALENMPHQVSIVPERRNEITTEGGLNAKEQLEQLIEIRKKFKNAKILFSLFVDPELSQIEAAKKIRADSVELNTGLYSELKYRNDIETELVKIQQAAKYADELGLRVFAGHGLNPKNVVAISAIPEITELNVGHNIVARSVYFGIEKSIKEMQLAIEQGIRLRNN